AAPECLDVRPAAGPGPGDNVRPAVAVHVLGRHGHAAAETWSVGEEALQQRPGIGEDFHMRPAASPGAGDDVRLAVAVDVTRGHEHTTGEVRAVSEEVGNDGEAAAIEDLDLGPTTGTGGGDDVGSAVAVDVADGHADAAGEGRIGKQLGAEVAGFGIV